MTTTNGGGGGGPATAATAAISADDEWEVVHQDWDLVYARSTASDKQRTTNSGAFPLLQNTPVETPAVSSFRSTLSSTLCKKRIESRLSIRELASLVHAEPDLIEKIEQNKYFPDAELMDKLQRVFEIRLVPFAP